MCNSNIFVFVSLSMFVFVSVFIYVFTTQLYQLTAQFGASAPLAALTSLKESNVSCMCLCMCLCLYWYMSLYLYICPAAVSSADSAVWDIRASRRFNFTVLSRSSHKQSSQVGRVHVYCVFVFVLYPFLSLHSPYCISWQRPAQLFNFTVLSRSSHKQSSNQISRKFKCIVNVYIFVFVFVSLLVSGFECCLVRSGEQFTQTKQSSWTEIQMQNCV